MKLLRRSLLKGLLAGSAAVVASPSLPRAFAAAADRPHAMTQAPVIAIVAGSPLDDAFLDHARRLGPTRVERVAGDALSHHEQFRRLLRRGQRVLALLTDADAVLFSEAVRHAGGSLLADERAGIGFVSFVAHV